MAFPIKNKTKVHSAPNGPISYTIGKSGNLMPSALVQVETMLIELETTEKTLTNELDQQLQTLPKELLNSSACDDIGLVHVLRAMDKPPMEKTKRPALPKKVDNQRNLAPNFAAPRKLVSRKRERVDLNLRADEARYPVSKIPRLQKTQNYEDELDSIFAQFSAQLYEAMKRYKSRKMAYATSRRVVQLHEDLKQF